MKRTIAMQTIKVSLLALTLTFAAHGGDVLAAEGDLIATVTVPVPAASGIGVSIAVDCVGNLYYTNYGDTHLYIMDAFGTLLDTKDMVDGASGAAITVGEMSWDESRMMLWAGSDLDCGVYLIDPATGVGTLQPIAGICSLIDGLAYDASDDTVWISNDAACDIFHFQCNTGAALATLTPKNAAGAPLCLISGVCVSAGGTLYLGQNGLGQIVRVDKSTGDWISDFSTPGGRDEGLECDPLNFGPTLVLWSKDAYNDTVTAMELVPNTCACGGDDPTATRSSSWGSVKSLFR